MEGREHLDELIDKKSGAVLLTAHMGSYDLAVRLFADRFKRTIYAVRAPERQADAQQMREAELTGERPKNLEIRYNEENNMLGVELAKAIGQGEIVAIQGDRILFDVSTAPTRYSEDKVINIPKGPFVLAAATGCPIYPVFIVRTGYRKYRVIARPAIYCRRDRKDDQEKWLSRGAEAFVEVFRPILRQYWRQWYVFEPAFEDRESA